MLLPHLSVPSIISSKKLQLTTALIFQYNGSKDLIVALSAKVYKKSYCGKVRTFSLPSFLFPIKIVADIKCRRCSPHCLVLFCSTSPSVRAARPTKQKSLTCALDAQRTASVCISSFVLPNRRELIDLILSACALMVPFFRTAPLLLIICC